MIKFTIVFHLFKIKIKILNLHFLFSLETYVIIDNKKDQKFLLCY
jgi:hypothetical protein